MGDVGDLQLFGVEVFLVWVSCLGLGFRVWGFGWVWELERFYSYFTKRLRFKVQGITVRMALDPESPIPPSFRNIPYTIML